MFSHVFVSVTDFDQALAFYTPLMVSLGLEQRFRDDARPWAGWHSAGGQRPLFVICKTFNDEPQDPGNGQMIAFTATNRAMVDSAYQVALANGGTSEGAPGLRPHYHANYYGAYFRDPDGNKFCVVSHGAD